MQRGASRIHYTDLSSGHVHVQHYTLRTIKEPFNPKSISLKGSSKLEPFKKIGTCNYTKKMEKMVQSGIWRANQEPNINKHSSWIVIKCHLKEERLHKHQKKTKQTVFIFNGSSFLMTFKWVRTCAKEQPKETLTIVLRKKGIYTLHTAALNSRRHIYQFWRRKSPPLVNKLGINVVNTNINHAHRWSVNSHQDSSLSSRSRVQITTHTFLAGTNLFHLYFILRIVFGGLNRACRNIYWINGLFCLSGLSMERSGKFHSAKHAS